MKISRSYALSSALSLFTSMLWLGCGAGDQSTNTPPFADPTRDNAIVESSTGDDAAGESGAGGDPGAPVGRPPKQLPSERAGGAGGEVTQASCAYDLDCAQPESRCEQVECVEGQCVVTPLSKGTVPNEQQPGDCKRLRCDGAGNEIIEDNDADVPEPPVANACEILSCSGGEPQSTFLPAGTPCDSGVCDGNGHCGVCAPLSRICFDEQTVLLCGADGDWQGSLSCGAGAPLCKGGQCLAVQAIAAGGDSSCAVLSDGSVSCWGNDDHGQLGSGAHGSAAVRPVRIEGLPPAQQVAIGRSHLCARLQDGTVRCWGGNTFGQLGVSPEQTTLSKAIAPSSAGLSVKQVVAGDSFTCALKQDGKVTCWGKNDKGQLGRISAPFDPSPADVIGLNDIVSLGAGDDFACAMTTAGAVSCWGANDRGQLGRANGSQGWQVQSIDGVEKAVGQLTVAAKHACVLDTGNRMYCWGDNSSGQISSEIFGKVSLPTPVEEFKHEPSDSFISGPSFSCVYTEHPEVLGVGQEAQLGCMGMNANGQLLTPPIDLQLAQWLKKKMLAHKLTAIAFGDRHGCALDDQGQVSCWGAGDKLQNGRNHDLDELTPIIW